jgi:hypothetical protein
LENLVDCKQASQITWGLVVVFIGLVMLAGQLDFGWNFGRLWPVIFLFIGVGKFLTPDPESRGSGLWFLFLGGLFLLHTFRVFTLSHSWPLFIVVAGLAMIFRRDRTKAHGGQVQP